MRADWVAGWRGIRSEHLQRFRQRCNFGRDQLVLKIPARKIGGQTLRHDLGTELAQPENESERSAAGSTHHNLSIRMEINFERLANSGSGLAEP